MIGAHQPRKRYGQHFLHDKAIIQKIIELINPQPEDTMVEIGPGQGALTQYLLHRTRELHVVEIDRDLANNLGKLGDSGDTFRLHCMDVLEFQLQELGINRARIIGNLPYNISTPLIFHLLNQLDQINDMIFMLQEEVVDRLNADPGCKTYGRLSVMVQSQCDVEKLMHVGSGAFTPAPRVDSAMVRLTPLVDRPVDINYFRSFSIIVRDSFNQRRKTLQNAIRHLMSAEEISRSGIDPGIRAEQLSVSQFATLARNYQDAAGK